MGFTPQQQAAIEVKGKTILVSAAAGSGKTFTLTERIIQKIIGDGENGADISRMLIVTFTRAAAGELKEKIYKKLSEAVAANPGNERLQKQLLTLGGASISTIDSFLSDPIRSNFDKIGIPPSLRIADESETEELRHEIMQQVLDEMYKKYSVCQENNLENTDFTSDFTNLVSVVSTAKNSSNMYKNLISLYLKLITSPAGCNQLKAFYDRLLEEADIDFFDTREGKVLRQYILGFTEHAISTVNNCKAYVTFEPETAKKFDSYFDSYIDWFDHMSFEVRKGYEQAQNAFKEKIQSRAPSVKDNPEWLYVKDKVLADLRNEKKKILDEYLSLSTEEIKEQYIQSAKTCNILYEILFEFDKRYVEQKIALGIVEFSDMPRFMMKLLVDQNGNLTETAKMLSESFDEVYIDEYQDVNEIQDKIFEIIGQNRRFMVGDIKQSIYGFREAEPSLFSEYRNKFPIYGTEEEKSSDGCTIFMSNNFRCDESVINFTNLLCSNIFSACPDSIGYKNEDDLRLTKNEPRGHFPVIINVIQNPDDSGSSGGDTEEDDIDDEEDGINGLFGDEAIIAANEISNLIQNGISANGERITPGDIAVLVSDKKSATPLMLALDTLGIPYSFSSNNKVLNGDDMKNLFNLLEIIDNPRSDVPLCNLITAQICKKSFFSVEEVITIRKASEDSKSLYDAIIDYSLDENDIEDDNYDLKNRCKEFISKTENLRLLSMRIPADRILRTISSDPYFSYLCDNPSFTYIYDSARRYTQNAYTGLYSFIDYFRDIMENGDSSVTEPDAKDANSITFMTIHQSKGLEFNTCFLFGMGKRFNFDDAKKDIIFDRHFCAATKILKYPDSDSEIDKVNPEKVNTIVRSTLALETKQKLVEERMRLLYVALTRARERLYLSFKLPKTFDYEKRKVKLLLSDSYAMKKVTSFTPWIISAILNLNGNDQTFVNVYNRSEASLVTKEQAESKATIVTSSDLRTAHYVELISNPEAVNPNQAILSVIPSKVAASKSSPDMLDKTIFIPDSTSDINSQYTAESEKITEESLKNRIQLMRSSHPDFSSVIDVNKKPTAAERGTAAHAFLQYCDYDFLEKHGVDAEIERLLNDKFIDERTSKIINRDQIQMFLNSNLFQMLHSAKNVRREFRFGNFESASEFTENDELKKILSDRKIYVQGSIDLLIENYDGSIYICDYKTDKLSVEEALDHEILKKNMTEKHENQLIEYQKAAELIFRKKIDKIFIYSLPAGYAVQIK